MPLVELTQENFDAETDKYPLILLDFWAPWCNPCKSFAPIYEAAAREHPDILFGKINCEDQANLAKQFEVLSIPTLIAVKDGTILEAKVGALAPPKFDKLVANLRK